MGKYAVGVPSSEPHCEEKKLASRRRWFSAGGAESMLILPSRIDIIGRRWNAHADST